MYSTLTSTNRPPEKIIPLLQSIQSQTIEPTHIFLVCDQEFTEESLQRYQKIIELKFPKTYFQKIIFITNLTHDFTPWKWVSYNRNFWIFKIKTKFLLSVDDDNIFEKDFVSNLIKISNTYHKKFKSDIVLIPTEYCRGRVRSRGYTKFRHRLWAQKPLNIDPNHPNSKMIAINDKKLYPIQFASSNCFFGPIEIFKQNQFDERMKFIYEDFDFFKRITNSWIPLFVVLDLNIDHQMRHKTKLEESYLEDEAGFWIYEKSKNRIIFVKNTATTLSKIIYFISWLRIHTIFLFIKILKYADKNKKKTLIIQLRKGISHSL